MTSPLYVAEPSGLWLARKPAVVDCSMMAAFLWNEPDATAAQTAMAGYELHAPDLLVYEIANVARNKLRRGAPLQSVQKSLDDWGHQRVDLHEVDLMHIFNIAQRYSLTAYDAAYLCVAENLKAPLLTLDQRLGEAAARHLDTGA